MLSGLLSGLFDIALALVLGVMFPMAGMAALVKSLRTRPTEENYRGRPVFAGLGIVWVLWAGGAFLANTLCGLVGRGLPSMLLVLAFPGLFAVVVFALGLIDDVYGVDDEKGFRGHLGAILEGRMTTGGLKLLGISFASYVMALVVLQSIRGETGLMPYLAAIPAGMVIALSANFVNLCDLRPGRALKVYLLVAFFGVLSTVLAFGIASQFRGLSPRFWADVVALTMFAIGPVLAVWRYDLGERGMLGDAGSNAAGAVAGMLLVIGLPLWATIVLAVLLLVLNVLSERVSFSQVIENTPLLDRIDQTGRALRKK